MSEALLQTKMAINVFLRANRLLQESVCILGSFNLSDVSACMEVRSALYLPHISNVSGASPNTIVGASLQSPKWDTPEPEEGKTISSIPPPVQPSSPDNMSEHSNDGTYRDEPSNDKEHSENLPKNLATAHLQTADVEAAESIREFSNQPPQVYRNSKDTSAEPSAPNETNNPSPPTNGSSMSFSETQRQEDDVTKGSSGRSTPQSTDSSSEGPSRDIPTDTLSTNFSSPSQSSKVSEKEVSEKKIDLKVENLVANSQNSTEHETNDVSQSDVSLSNSPQGDSKIGATVPGDGHICANCKASKTPLWRRGPNGQVLCNACGLYIKARNIHRPLTLKRTPTTKSVPLKNALGSCLGDGRCNGTGGSQSCNKCPSFLNNSRRNRAGNGATDADGVKMISCQNCGTVNTPLWRRDVQGHVICNACGLYNRMHRDGRPSGLQTAIVKRRKRHRSLSEEQRAAMDSPEKAEHSDPSRPSSNDTTPQLPPIVPLQPRTMGRPLPNSPGIPVSSSNYHLSPHYAQQQQQLQQHQQALSDPSRPNQQSPVTHTKTEGEQAALCCTHPNPSRNTATPEYHAAPPGYPPASAVHPAHSQYSYIPVQGMPLPSMPPGGHFALGQLPPPIQMPYNPYGQQPMASMPPPTQAPPQVALTHPSAPLQAVPQAAPQTAQPAVAQPSPTALQGTPTPLQTEVPSQGQPAATLLQNAPATPVKSAEAESRNVAIPASLGSKTNLSNTRMEQFEDDNGDSPLAVLQYLKGASQDTKKEYLLAAQRQLHDKISQFKHRLGVAEYHLGMCENALRTINQEQ